MRVRFGDRWVSVEAVPHPYRSWGKHFTKETPAQARALVWLKASLTDPASWLPTAAWAEREIKTFVPSRYWVAYDRSSPDASTLPPEVPELLDGVFLYGCQVMTTGETRTILRALVEGGISPIDNQADGIGFGLSGVSAPSYLHFHPALPDVTTCELIH